MTIEFIDYRTGKVFKKYCKNQIEYLKFMKWALENKNIQILDSQKYYKKRK